MGVAVPLSRFISNQYISYYAVNRYGRTHGEKLKNWYIQEYRTGSTFEPDIIFKNALRRVIPTMVET